MNKQKPPGGIGWTRIQLADGTVLPGYTANPVAGCHHGCKWTLEGTEVQCYAKGVAEGVAKSAYPEGFDQLYLRTSELNALKRHKGAAGVFLGSMTDLFGWWVPDDRIMEVVAVMRETPYITYQLLTKNPGRLLHFANALPANVWVGVSSPPDVMNGKTLVAPQKHAFVHRTLDVFQSMAGTGLIRFMSLEPLSWAVGLAFYNWLHSAGYDHLPLDWAIIGAGSDGQKKYQPRPEDFQFTERMLNHEGRVIPVYHKSNLHLPGVERRTEFPSWMPVGRTAEDAMLHNIALKRRDEA